MKVNHGEGVDKSLILSKSIVIIGFGSQAHAQASNLKNSGCKDITIVLRKGSASQANAEKAGFKVALIEGVISSADVVMLLAPDECHAEIYENNLKSDMKPGSALAFSHGLSIHFALIKPREDIDVFMVAPKGPGHTVLSEYNKGGGVPCLVSVHQDYTGNASNIANSYAVAIGGAKGGMINTSFKDECETDLFGEQAVLCGGIQTLITSGFEVLVEAGYPAEMAYFECLHEMKLIVDLLYEGGLTNMNYSVSNTAEYGGHVSGPAVVGSEVKERMKGVLSKIQDSSFVKDYTDDYKNNFKHLMDCRSKLAAHPIEKVGAEIREMMPWIKEGELVKDKK